MKTRIEVIERVNGTKEYYAQFRGWFIWHYFSDPMSSHDKYLAWSEVAAERHLSYQSSETKTLDFAEAVIAKYFEMEARRIEKKKGAKVSKVGYLV